MTAPFRSPAVERDARVLHRRYLTAGGTGCNLAVPTGATSLAVTLARREYDAGYGVTVTPSWLTIVAVTAKTTTGFTVTFGTAAPAGATVDYSLFRSE